MIKAPVFLLACGLLWPMACGAADSETAVAGTSNVSAYAAMRVAAKDAGAGALSRIVEVSGHDGVPQPFLWKVVFKEKTGVKEIDVADGKIAARREVANSEASAVIHLKDLNLDSTGAFDAADAQARKTRMRFDSINYVLRAAEASGKPLWTLELFDKDGAPLGTMHLAARDGTITTIDGKLAAQSSGPGGSPAPALVTTATAPVAITTTTVADTAPVGAPPAPAPTETTVVEAGETHDEGGFFTRTGHTLDRRAGDVKRSFERAKNKVQRFFTRHSDSDDRS